MAVTNGTKNYYDEKHPPRCSPIWGFPAHFTIADLGPTNTQAETKAIDNVAVGTTSAALSVGARGVALMPSFTVATATCTVSLYNVVGGVDTLVKTWTGVKYGDALYATNLEMVDLGGLPLKVEVASISAGNVTVLVKVIE